MMAISTHHGSVAPSFWRETSASGPRQHPVDDLGVKPYRSTLTNRNNMFSSVPNPSTFPKGKISGSPAARRNHGPHAACTHHAIPTTTTAECIAIIPLLGLRCWRIGRQWWFKSFPALEQKKNTFHDSTPLGVGVGDFCNTLFVLLYKSSSHRWTETSIIVQIHPNSP